MSSLSPFEVERLGRALSALESMAPALDALLLPSAPPPSSGGRPPSRRGPRPPLPIHLLDIQCVAELCLRGWAVNLADDVQYAQPKREGIELTARWLHDRIHDVAEREWASECLEEVEHHCRVVADIVDPPETQQRERSAVPERGSARQVSDALAVLGVRVSHTTLRAWAKAGRIHTTLTEQGVELFDVAVCLQVARAWMENGDCHRTG